MTGIQHQQFCRNMAALLSYPGQATRLTAESCADLLRDGCPEASSLFAGFLGFLNGYPVARIEEIYTATFDLQPSCHPYVGYQLCGENQKRAIFLMKLQRLYREHGFKAEDELADHLAILLNFVADVDDQQCREELVRDGILPALDKMLLQAEHVDNPYIQLLQVVRLVLARSVPAVTVPPVELRRKEVYS